MAFNATTHWEVETAGNDTNCGGGFDPANANMATDLTATNGTTATPTVLSASYNFAARDVNYALFVQSGTNWSPGWYKISSVVGNGAVINASNGAACNYTTLAPTTLVGVSSVASPTAGKWSIDYSQNGTPGINYSDLVIGATNTTYTSVLNPVGPNLVGNVLSVTSGTNFTVQRVQIISVATITATVDKGMGTVASVAGNGGLGGAFGSPGAAGGVFITGNEMWIQSGSYTVTNASTNVTNGCLVIPVGTTAQGSKVKGYGSVRGDLGTMPVLTASGISSFTMVSMNSATLENVAFNGANLTSSRGVTSSGTLSMVFKCKFSNFTNGGFGAATTGPQAHYCEATGCSSVAAMSGGQFFGCNSHDNTNTGFQIIGNNVAVFCIAYNNTGSNIFGFQMTGGTAVVANCIAFGNGGTGFMDSSANPRPDVFVNCISTGNGVTGASGYGFDATSADDYTYCENCAASGTGASGFNNASGTINTAHVLPANTRGLVILTSDPFVATSSGNFNLNAYGISVLAGKGFPTSYPGSASNTNFGLPIGGSVPAASNSNGTTTTVISGPVLRHRVSRRA